MEANKNNWVEAKNEAVNGKNGFKATAREDNQPCCGRSYNEVPSFSQVNFAAFQDILDKRNELLGTVKINHSL